MLTIDRVETQLELLSADRSREERPASRLDDPVERERFREAVLAVLREEVRALERGDR